MKKIAVVILVDFQDIQYRVKFDLEKKLIMFQIWDFEKEDYFLLENIPSELFEQCHEYLNEIIHL